MPPFGLPFSFSHTDLQILCINKCETQTIKLWKWRALYLTDKKKILGNNTKHCLWTQYNINNYMSACSKLAHWWLNNFHQVKLVIRTIKSRNSKSIVKNCSNLYAYYWRLIFFLKYLDIFNLLKTQLSDCIIGFHKFVHSCCDDNIKKKINC